jgi:hypothetical protein
MRGRDEVETVSRPGVLRNLYEASHTVSVCPAHHDMHRTHGMFTAGQGPGGGRSWAQPPAHPITLIASPGVALNQRDPPQGSQRHVGFCGRSVWPAEQQLEVLGNPGVVEGCKQGLPSLVRGGRCRNRKPETTATANDRAGRHTDSANGAIEGSAPRQ